MTSETLATVAQLHPVTQADAATLVAAWLATLRFEQGLSERTVDTYRHHVGRFTDWLDGLGLDVVSVGRQHIRTYMRNEAARGLAPSTRATALYAIRSFYAYLAEEEMVPVNPTVGMTVPGAATQRTLVYSDEEADAICAWAHDRKGTRWMVGASILQTFRFGGIRLAELCSLRLDRVDLGAKRLSVVGKGSKERTVPIPPVLATSLTTYINDVRPSLPDSPFVFVNPRGIAGREFHGRFSPWSVEDIVRQAGEGAGVSERHFPHRWRHTYATSLLRRGVDIYKVKRLLGHAKLVTTERYLHLTIDDLADAVDQAFPVQS